MQGVFAAALTADIKSDSSRLLFDARPSYMKSRKCFAIYMKLSKNPLSLISKLHIFFLCCWATQRPFSINCTTETLIRLTGNTSNHHCARLASKRNSFTPQKRHNLLNTGYFCFKLFSVILFIHNCWFKERNFKMFCCLLLT